MLPFYIRPYQLESLEDRIAPATLLITTLSDDANDTGSLRHAINEANLHKGKDTIAFDKTFFATPQILTLTSNLPTITDSLVINGPGAKNFTIDGNAAYRIFHIDDGDNKVTKTITISGLTLSNGDATNQPESDGGAILCRETLALTNSVISGNAAVDGGGVYAGNPYSSSNLVVKNTKFINNTSSGSGGGLHAYVNDIKIIGSLFSGNLGHDGGGLYAEAGNVIIDKTTFLNNEATNDGGGAHLFSFKKAIIKNSVVSGNTATKLGGGLSLRGTAYYGNFTFDKVLISGNSAYEGGGLNEYQTHSLKIKSSQFLNNNASLDGGGLSLNVNGLFQYNLRPVSITGSLISGNTSEYDGGGIYALGGGVLNISKTQITGNKAIGPNANGGGILFNNLVANLSATISGNETTNHGGGIYAASEVTLNLKGSTISGNHADKDGGGMYVANATNIISVSSAKFLGNTADNNGGGIASFTYGGLTIAKSLFTGNVATDNGGGVYAKLTQQTKAAIQSSNFTNNKSLNGTGGGIFLNSDMGTTASITGTLFAQNSAKGNGGGLFLNGAGAKTLTGLNILDNFSEAAGGGIFLDAGSLILQKGTISGNIATTKGGGIYNNTTNNATTTVNGTKISENFAPIDSDTSGI